MRLSPNDHLMVVEESTILKRGAEGDERKGKRRKKKEKGEKRKERILLIQTRFRASYIMAWSSF